MAPKVTRAHFGLEQNNADSLRPGCTIRSRAIAVYSGAIWSLLIDERPILAQEMPPNLQPTSAE